MSQMIIIVCCSMKCPLITNPSGLGSPADPKVCIQGCPHTCGHIVKAAEDTHKEEKK